MSEKKILHWRDSVHAAQTLFEIHSREQDCQALIDAIGEPAVLDSRGICREWYAFVHAGLVYGLMEHAPNIVVVEYVRSTHAILEHCAGYSAAEADLFVDEAFTPYLDFLSRNEAKLCAVLFLQRVFGHDDIRAVPSKKIAFVSGMMALTLSGILDAMEDFDMRATDSADTDTEHACSEKEGNLNVLQEKR